MITIQPEKTLDSELHFTRKEIGDLFSVSAETVKRRTSEHLLRPIAVNSRVIHYTLNDVRAMMKQSYILDFKKALAYGIRPESVGLFNFIKSSSDQTKTLPLVISHSESHPITASVNASDDYGSEIFLAKLRWALRQPEMRNVLRQLLSEQDARPASSHC